VLRIEEIMLRNEQGCRTGLKKGHNDQTLYSPIMHLILVVIWQEIFDKPVLKTASKALPGMA